MKIIAVDYDGTLYKNGIVNNALINRLKAAQSGWDIVILWTCRCGLGLMDAVKKLYNNGFVPNYINQNAPNGVKRMGHESRKIYADIYIDDKAIKW